MASDTTVTAEVPILVEQEPEGAAAPASATLREAVAGGGTGDIRPFHVADRQGAVDDLRRRIFATRRPDREAAANRSQDNRLATTNDVARILDDIRVAIRRSPRDAREAASRLVTLLDQPVAQPESVRGGLAPWQKRKIERHVKERLAESLLVDELACQVSLSASYFARAFKEAFGTSPHAYVTRQRLEAAQAMMIGTEEPLSQIAFACGFADQSHLCRIFRREVNEPPGVWRRRTSRGAYGRAQ